MLTNDDGYKSKGIKILFRELKNIYDIVIVAPDSEKSGISHAFTYNHPLFYKKISNTYTNKMYSISGYPADCIKFALSHILSEYPDLIVAGLNIGENSGISSFYSGTVAAAREGAFWKIPSIAFSICKQAEKYSEEYTKYIPKIIDEILINISNKYSIFYNVNFPNCNPVDIMGFKITRQSVAFFDDKYKRINVMGKKFTRYEIYGEKINIEKSDDFDSRALKNGWITITPHTFDSTAYNEIKKIKKIETILNKE